MVVVLGAFDGFHSGHKKLFSVAKDVARRLRTDWGVLTFEPNPGLITGKIKAPLFTPIERELSRRVLNIPNLYNIKFNDELRNLSALEFLIRLKSRVNIEAIVVGDNFRFGFERQGNIETIKYFCVENNIVYAIVHADPDDISSTKLRMNLNYGMVENIMYYLGYPWFIWTKVIHGNQRGRGLGFPTANLDIYNRISLVPRSAVYAAVVPIFEDNDVTWHPAVVSIGKNPTFSDVNKLRVEAHIIGFNGDLYDKDIQVFFIDRLRKPQVFENGDALAAQIGKDIKIAEKVVAMTMKRQKLQDIFASFATSIMDMKHEIDTEGDFKHEAISFDDVSANEGLSVQVQEAIADI